MKEFNLKKWLILLGSIVFFSSCPAETYDAPKPLAEAGKEVCVIECVKSSTATKTEWSAEEFSNKILKDPGYLRVTTAHALHDSGKGFEFEPLMNKINQGHQHGKQKIPFLMKDSVGVWAESFIEIFIAHDNTTPIVQPPALLGEIPYGEAVTTALLSSKMGEQEDFVVTLNPCADATSKKFTLVEWDYPINLEENQNYTVHFKVKDALGNISEKATTQFHYGENLTGAPKITQLKPLVLDCKSITSEKIEEKLVDPTCFDIVLKPTHTLIKAEVVSGLEDIIPNTHYHNPSLQVVAMFVDSGGLITRKAINVKVEPYDKDHPSDIALPAAGAKIISILKKENPYPPGLVSTILGELVKNAIIPSMVKINSECAKPNFINVEIVSHSLQETQIGVYDLTLKITDSLGFEVEGGDRHYKIGVIAGVPDGIPLSIALEGKTLYLTHYDAFDDLDVLKENWDIGNPGYGYDGEGLGVNYDQYKVDLGNPGIPMPTLVSFADGIKGYSGDRYKQPYWSPKGVAITPEGQLEISTFWDPTINNPSGIVPGVFPASGVLRGYGIAGAIHSKRQFPCGFFLTKIRHSTGKRGVHWDAFWAESNNPFSRAYGSKELFMPPGAENREKRGKVYRNGMVSTASDRGLNGEQVYEFDVYEWVRTYDRQFQVTHAWSWYGGYPGNENRPSDGGHIQLLSTLDDLRDYDFNGFPSGSQILGDFSGGMAHIGEWFYLAMLVTPDSIQMWNSPVKSSIEASLADPINTEKVTKQKGGFGNSELDTIWPADEWAPIQVKYSMELGDWANNHNLIYNIKDEITYENRDKMFAEFFAFYAWNTDKYPHF